MTKYIFVVLIVVSSYGVACVEDEPPTDEVETVIVHAGCFTDDCVGCIDDCLATN